MKGGGHLTCFWLFLVFSFIYLVDEQVILHFRLLINMRGGGGQISAWRKSYLLDYKKLCGLTINILYSNFIHSDFPIF